MIMHALSCNSQNAIRLIQCHSQSINRIAFFKPDIRYTAFNNIQQCYLFCTEDVNPPRSIDLKMVQASPSIHNCQPDQSDVLQERRLLPCSPIHTWAGKKVLQVYFINPDILEKSVSIAKIMSWASTWNSPA